MRISRAMSCERGSKRPRMHSDIEDANDMYNGVVEESVHVGGTSFHSDDEVGEGVTCVDADELNMEECGTESSTSATEDTSDDESDDEWFFFLDDMFLLVADCVSDEAWARALDSGVPLNNSIAKLWAAGAGFFDESD